MESILLFISELHSHSYPDWVIEICIGPVERIRVIVMSLSHWGLYSYIHIFIDEIIDTYSGFSKHGGGAFSGKDYTKVDRTASYYARYVCKNIVAAGLAKKIELQVSYAIGVAKEISLNINTFNTNKLPNEKILEIIKENFNFSPSNMIKELNLKNIKYQDTTNYSHFGKDNLPWEQLNKVNILKKYLN